MPAGSVVELIARGVPDATIESVIVADAVWAAASLTVTPKEKVPLPFGDPETTPLEARLSPLGRLPEEIDQVYGAVPPTACRVLAYVELWVPAGKENELIVRGDGVPGVAATESVTVVVADWAAELESETATLKEKLPTVVGVPEMIPVLDARVRPPGSFPARFQV